MNLSWSQKLSAILQLAVVGFFVLLAQWAAGQGEVVMGGKIFPLSAALLFLCLMSIRRCQFLEVRVERLENELKQRRDGIRPDAISRGPDSLF